MYTPLPLLTLLLPLLATAAPTPDASNQTGTNTPNAPSFMQGTNQTLSAWSRGDCNNNSNGHENIWIPHVLYGKNNHALVTSFMLGRDMEENERLDFSFFENPEDTRPTANGTDAACARFQYAASPDASGATLKANQCYKTSMPVTCVNMWKTS